MSPRIERRLKMFAPKPAPTIYKCVQCPKTIEPGAPGRSYKGEGWRCREHVDSTTAAPKFVHLCSDECERITERYDILRKDKFITRTKRK